MNAFESLIAAIEEHPLSRSLPIALRIANSVGDEELARWVKLELMGYFAENPAMGDDVIVPEYRSVAGVWYDDFDRQLVVVDPKQSFVNEIRLRSGVAELEGIAAGTGLLAIRPPEFLELLRTKMKVEVTMFRFRPSSVSQVLTNIKVQLLEKVAARRDGLLTLTGIQTTNETEILELKPSVYGVTVDLKALWRRLFGGRKREGG